MTEPKKISEIIKVIEVSPAKDVVVKMRECLPWRDDIERLKITDNEKRGVFVLTKLIESWNLINDDGSPVEITEEVIVRLPSHIALPLIEKANELVLQHKEKKTS